MVLQARCGQKRVPSNVGPHVEYGSRTLEKLAPQSRGAFLIMPISPVVPDPACFIRDDLIPGLCGHHLARGGSS
jgi:hypothetical protein